MAKLNNATKQNSTQSVEIHCKTTPTTAAILTFLFRQIRKCKHNRNYYAKCEKKKKKNRKPKRRTDKFICGCLVFGVLVTCLISICNSFGRKLIARVASLYYCTKVGQKFLRCCCLFLVVEKDGCNSTCEISFIGKLHFN